ncbi:hypothetical protein BDN70DRAFT_870976 [Pholiota conissans]|uniref:Uncharacterized protein n=1 Tax=Pholiota conissans TaxID=109636 RepID=A0A9P5ZDX7_9AGAR|nr:hypothetical protein BDN70DRAFT_870976 [Pholiota conissans]
MSHYPFRHSTYWTGGDAVYTSELPPMNSMEDILQDIFMRDRSTIYVAKPAKFQAFKKLKRSFNKWRRECVSSTSSFLFLPRSTRKGF